MGAVSTTIGYRDESFRAPAEFGSIEDFRRAYEQLSRRIDIAMNRLDKLEAAGRVTGNTTLTEFDRVVHVNTDSAAVTIQLPAGTAGQYYRIVNTGSSANAVTITPDGSELVVGASSFGLADGESLIIVYDVNDGWF